MGDQEMLDSKDQVKCSEKQDIKDKQKKLHKCPHEGCEASFNRPYRLEQHILLHFNFRPFACTEKNCKKSYSSKSHLLRHVNGTHFGLRSGDDVNRCPSCFKMYANHQNLKRHMKSHISKLCFTCDICNMEFRNSNQLSTHKYQHTGVKPFVCELCSQGFMTHEEKKRHLSYHKIYNCDDCGVQFNHWNKFRAHRKAEHKRKAQDYICNECGKLYKRRCDILRHLRTHFKPFCSKIFVCPHENCERVYTTKSNLKQHISVKHMQIFHVCELCNAQLSTKAKLNYHLNLHVRIGQKNQEMKQSESEVQQETDEHECANEDAQIIEVKIEPEDILPPSSPDSIKKAKLNYYLNLHEQLGQKNQEMKPSESKQEIDKDECANEDGNVPTDLLFVEVKIEPEDIVQPSSPDTIKNAKLNDHLNLHERIGQKNQEMKPSEVKPETDEKECANADANVIKHIQFIEIKIEPEDVSEPSSPDSVKRNEET